MILLEFITKQTWHCLLTFTDWNALTTEFRGWHRLPLRLPVCRRHQRLFEQAISGGCAAPVASKQATGATRVFHVGTRAVPPRQPFRELGRLGTSGRRVSPLQKNAV